MTHDPLSHTQRLYARRLRRSQTAEEAILWTSLRGRKFEGVKFRRQHPFGPFILDFYCADRRLAIELEGGEHNRRRASEYDRRRSLWLESMGIRELRFWNSEVRGNLDGVLAEIAAALTEAPSRAPAAPLRPLPRGEAK